MSSSNPKIGSDSLYGLDNSVFTIPKYDPKELQ